MSFRGPRLLLTWLLAAGVCTPVLSAQQNGDTPIFRAGVDLVSVTAVVRDKQGRVVRSLTQKDFEVIDAGQTRPILDLQADANAPAAVALLVDGSGSMRLSSGLESSRRISDALLRQLNAAQDDAALMSFDTRLLTLREFTREYERIRSGLSEVAAFGATSVYDAIAGTAARVADRTRKRRAVVVITDGSDNSSAYTPDEVGWIASTIDVPVYVFAVGEALVPAENAPPAPNPLMELARATGGEYFFASSATHQRIAVGRLVDELRHQYLIAFEPSSFNGLRKLEIRTRNAELRVKSRKWYFAGSAD
jgi:Ca-activated chloride channel homolog